MIALLRFFLPHKTTLAVTTPLLFLLAILLCTMEKARAEWIPIDPLGDLPDEIFQSGEYRGYGNGLGALAYPESPVGGSDTTYHVALYDLSTGHRIWTQHFLPNDRGAFLGYAFATVTRDSFVYMFINDGGQLRSQVYNWDGTVNRPWVGFTPPPPNQEFGVDDGIVGSNNRLLVEGGHFWRASAINGIELDTTYLDTITWAYYRIAEDDSGGAYIWRYTRDTGRHDIWHISSTGHIQGPVFVQQLLVDLVIGITYCSHTHKLFLYDAQTTGGVHTYSHEIDPDSLTLRSTHQISPTLSAFAADADTTWQLTPISGFDTSGQNHILYRVLYAYTTGPNWVPVDTIPNQFFVHGITDRGSVIISNPPDLTILYSNHGVTRRHSIVSVRTTYSVPVARSNIQMFPNPTNGSIVVSQLLGHGGRLRMYNTLGQTVAEYGLPTYRSANSVRFPNSLSSGEYFIEVKEAGGDAKFMKVNLVR